MKVLLENVDEICFTVSQSLRLFRDFVPSWRVRGQTLFHFIFRSISIPPRMFKYHTYPLYIQFPLNSNILSPETPLRTEDGMKISREFHEIKTRFKPLFRKTTANFP